jgi:hypothetical protein
MLTLGDGIGLTLAVTPVFAVTIATVVIAVADVLHLAITIDGAP